MTTNGGKKELIGQLIGWIFFVICGALFMVPGFKYQDGWTIWGCVFFLGGCVFFMVPLVKAILSAPPDQSD